MRRFTHSLLSSCRGLVPLGTWLSLMLGSGSALAEPAPAARYAIEQPSQAMADALRAIARQTGTSVLFEPEAVAGRVARPVSGRLSPIEAIRAALQGTGMSAELMADGAVVVKPGAASTPVSPASGAPASAPANGRSGLVGTGGQPGPEVAQAGTGAEADRDVVGRPETLTRVEVTGSRLKRVDAEGPAPVNVYTRQDIERSGQPSLQRFLAGLSEVSASTGEGGFGSTLGQGTVQLRGLPLGSTLVLINGRRVEAVGSSTGSVFNLNLIPMAAIERVEVVPLGSSAVYGGDALAGVVNVILKHSLEGQSLAARVGSGKGISDGSVSLTTGGRSAEGSYLLMGSYSRSSPLSMLDRGFFRDADYRRFGGTDERLNYCAPGTVSSVDGSNLPGLGASSAGIPASTPGQPLRASDFAATAGQANLCNVWTTGGGVALIHGYETLAVHGLAERRLQGSWAVFGEATVVKDRMQAKDVGLLLDGVTVPAGNPFNPFGVPVSVTAALGPENGVQSFARQSNFTRVLAGVKGELSRDWDAEVTISTSGDRNRAETGNDQTNAAALSAALSSTSPATALNPFTAGRAATDAVLQGIWSDTYRHDRGRKDQLTALARGSLGDGWGAGSVDAVIGAEAARDWYDMSVVGQSEIHGDRSSSAVYGEVRAPLWRAAQPGSTGWDLAALTVAARRDHYSDFGSADTFQGGLEIRPSRHFLIRASGANSFKPPTLLQTHVSDSTFQAAIFRLTDPARGGERITSGTVVRTTNKALAPEQGQARGLGAVWESEDSLGARVSAPYWQLRIRGMIAVLRPQAALDYESLFPGFVTRGPSVNGQPGVVTSVKTAEVNFGRLDTAGTDLDLAYTWKTDAGRLTASLGGTRTQEYRVVVAPGAATVDRLGRRFADFWAPRLKGRLSVGLEDRAWNLSLTSRYLGRYWDAGTSDRRLGGYWTHDLAGGINLKNLWPDLIPGVQSASLGLTVTNLLNREPQYAQGAPFYDVTQADWRGRYASLRLSLDW